VVTCGISRSAEVRPRGSIRRSSIRRGAITRHADPQCGIACHVIGSARSGCLSLILRYGVIGKGLKKLLRGPFCGWMRRDVEVNNPATLVRENDENVENTKGEGRDGEEIDGGKLFGVVFQKRSPGLRGRFGKSDHVLSDGCLGDIDTEFEQLTVNSRCSPEKIASLMVRMSSRISLEILGLPDRPHRLFQVQNKWKPLRCHAMTVSGLTMMRAGATLAKDI
jgi:hypothetical protein